MRQHVAALLVRWYGPLSLTAFGTPPKSVSAGGRRLATTALPSGLKFPPPHPRRRRRAGGGCGAVLPRRRTNVPDRGHGNGRNLPSARRRGGRFPRSRYPAERRVPDPFAEAV